MDKKKIRKDLTDAHKAIKPINTKRSHKDMKHVASGMQYLQNAFQKTQDPEQPQAFFKKHGLAEDKKARIWSMTQNGVSHQVTTSDMFNVLRDAKKYIKMHY